MFDTPAYASYIQLCRELRLAREFTDGDWLSWAAPTVGEWSVGPWSRDQFYMRAGLDYCIWLPRLDQWLAMLEEVPHAAEVGFSWNPAGWTAHLDRTWEPPALDEAQDHQGTLTGQDGPLAPTPEEAVARLWMAVTGRATDAARG